MKSKGLILMYHRVADPAVDSWGTAVTPSNFSAHLRCIRREYDVLPLSRVAASARQTPMPRRWIVVTFDDGYADNLHGARPLLDQYAVPATVFVVSGQVGAATEFWWDELEKILIESPRLPPTLTFTTAGQLWRWDLGEAADADASVALAHRHWRAWEPTAPTQRHTVYRAVHKLMLGLRADERQRVFDELRRWSGTMADARPVNRAMSCDELREISADGRVEIAAHSVSHTPLYLLSRVELRTEVRECKTALERILGRTVAHFSYPFGSYVTETVTAVRDAGYDSACRSLAHEDVLALGLGAPEAVIDEGVARDRFLFPRVMVENWSASELSDRLATWFGD